MDNIKPFTKSHVLRLTAKNMRRHIDVSIRKTFDRVKDFEGDNKASKEVFETLDLLHRLRGKLDEFQAEYSEAFTQKPANQGESNAES